MEFYLMPMFNKLCVQDIAKSEKWYSKTLGFKSVFKFRNDKQQVLMNHLRLAKYQDIILITNDTDWHVGNAIYLNLLVDDIDAVAARVSPKNILEPLTLKPWNAYELTLKDPDGHQITLTQPLIKQEAFDDVIQQIQLN